MRVNDLLQYVRFELPGVLDLLIEQALVATAADFCTRTLVWDEIQDPVALVDGVSQYDMEAPSDARALTIAQVWVAGQELTPATLVDLSRALPNWQVLTAPQPIYYNAAIDWSAITLYPTPLAAGGALMTMRAQYAPKLGAATLPDFLVTRFLDALCAGAKSRLMLQVNVPWSNPAVGAVHQGIYENAVTVARIAQMHDRVPGVLQVAPRRFG